MDIENKMNEILKKKNVNIYIIRHGESVSNYISHKRRSSFYYKVKYRNFYNNKKYQDCKLTGLGKFQAIKLKDFFLNNNIKFDYTYCSPLIRVLETAYSSVFETRNDIISSKIIINDLVREIIRYITDLPNDYNITREKITNEMNYCSFEKIFDSCLMESINDKYNIYPPIRKKFTKLFDSDSYKDYIDIKSNCKKFWETLISDLQSYNISTNDGNDEINIGIYSHAGFLDIFQKEILKRYLLNKDTKKYINHLSIMKNTEIRKISFKLNNRNNRDNNRDNNRVSNYRNNINNINNINNRDSYKNENKNIILSIKSIYRFNN